MKKITKVKLNSAHADLEQFDLLAKKGDYIEVTEWWNGEGWDINISHNGDRSFSLTDGEFEAVKKLIKELNKNEISL